MKDCYSCKFEPEWFQAKNCRTGKCKFIPDSPPEWFSIVEMPRVYNDLGKMFRNGKEITNCPAHQPKGGGEE